MNIWFSFIRTNCSQVVKKFIILFTNFRSLTICHSYLLRSLFSIFISFIFFILYLWFTPSLRLTPSICPFHFSLSNSRVLAWWRCGSYSGSSNGSTCVVEASQAFARFWGCCWILGLLLFVGFYLVLGWFSDCGGSVEERHRWWPGFRLVI